MGDFEARLLDSEIDSPHIIVGESVINRNSAILTKTTIFIRPRSKSSPNGPTSSASSVWGMWLPCPGRISRNTRNYRATHLAVDDGRRRFSYDILPGLVSLGHIASSSSFFADGLSLSTVRHYHHTHSRIMVID
ncbi:hypothetical protein WA026_019726 [Henosepilachna vigintioctopunctata]|uniref:Uncharacterized protein n=1 Tax=Henosepilachna vigintioctopunctata TaxID=420089 RepID=A0AAW1UNW3_9CUCU